MSPIMKQLARKWFGVTRANQIQLKFNQLVKVVALIGLLNRTQHHHESKTNPFCLNFTSIYFAYFFFAINYNEYKKQAYITMVFNNSRFFIKLDEELIFAFYFEVLMSCNWYQNSINQEQGKASHHGLYCSRKNIYMHVYIISRTQRLSTTEYELY